MKIKKAEGHFWYAKHIGEEYEVIGYVDKRKKQYKVIEDSRLGIMYIYVDDCEITDNSPYRVNFKYEILDFIKYNFMMKYIWIGIVIAVGIAYSLLIK